MEALKLRSSLLRLSAKPRGASMANDDDIKKLLASLNENVAAIATLMREIKELVEEIGDELRSGQ